MAEENVFSRSRVVAFISTAHHARARAFYEGVLNFRVVSEELPFALVFDINGILMRLTRVNDYVPSPSTVLGWHVPDLDATVRHLSSQGVTFLRYRTLDEDDPYHIWLAPDGARVVWFKDPDGNILSIGQPPGFTGKPA